LYVHIPPGSLIRHKNKIFLLARDCHEIFQINMSEESCYLMLSVRNHSRIHASGSEEINILRLTIWRKDLNFKQVIRNTYVLVFFFFCDKISGKTTSRRKDLFGITFLVVSVHGQLAPLLWALRLGRISWWLECVVNQTSCQTACLNSCQKGVGAWKEGWGQDIPFKDMPYLLIPIKL
jgi:hypothetical protein